MGFWDKAAGGLVAPPRQEAPAYPQSQPWFAQGIPQAPSQVPTPQQYAMPGYPQPTVDPHEEAARMKALSARSTALCPGCGSDNIFKPVGMPNMMEQCYNCGWNPRFGHSTAGAGLPAGEATGPATPARQVSTANNFNPQTIVAKVT